MLVLGLDLETTTFDQDILRITEVGAVLYDTDLKCPIEVQADLVYEPDIPLPMDTFVVGLTGITDDMIKNYGKKPEDVLGKFFDLYKRAEYIVAHNGNEFDRPAMQNFIARYYSQDLMKANGIEPKHWIDTMTDVPYGEYINTRKLEDLTGRHGFLNPFPHRAFTDVMSMLRIMSEYDFDEVVKISHSPTLKFHANVDYHNKDVAKQAGFKWDTAARKWWYKMKECFIDQEAYANGTLWDFPYSEVKND
jgi:DNA polymerase-3 subunit epsilon